MKWMLALCLAACGPASGYDPGHYAHLEDAGAVDHDTELVPAASATPIPDPKVHPYTP